MKSLKLLSLLVFSFLFPLPISCYTVSNYEIRDLESTTSYFQQESLTWTSSNKISLQNVTQCSGTWLLGGYGITSTNTLFKRSYTDLAPHTALYFSFTFWVLDLSYFTFNLGNFLKISSDSLALQYWSSSYLRTLLSSSICGGSGPDYPSITITGKLAHSQPVFNLQIQSLVSSSYATFGFRNINILLLNTSAPIYSSACVFNTFFACPIYVTCRRERINQPNLGQTSCLCPQGTFDSLLGLFCVPCNPACETCFGPSASQCASCNEGYYWNGNECVLCDSSCARCKGPGRNDCLRCKNDDFLFWNGTCQGACETPLKQGLREDIEICQKPCEDHEFLYWNGSCLGGCEAPLVEGIGEFGLKNCSLPCEEDWYWGLNGTCQEICEYPLVEIEQGDLKICGSPCVNLGEFLYWSGSCLENCPLSFQENLGGDKFLCLEHCPTENFTYWNQSCLGDCHPPFISETDSEGLNSCKLPCNISIEGPFLYQNSSCLEACKPPFTTEPLTEGISLCNLSCDLAEYYSLDDFSCVNACDSPKISEQIGLLKTCQTLQEITPSPENNTPEGPPPPSALETLGQVTSSVAAVVGLLNFNDPTSIFVLILSDLLRYIKYIEVSYPQKVEDLFNTEDQLFSITFAMGYNVNDKFKSELPEHKIPQIFQKRNLHSSFLINNWDQLIFLVISLIAIGVYYPFFWLINRTGVKFLIKGTKRIKGLLKWNLFLMLFLTNYAEITLYSGLELMTFTPSSVLAVFSLITCLVMILLGIYFLYKIFRISLQLIHSARKINPLNDPEQQQTVIISHKYDGYKILYEAYKNTSIFTQGYLFFFTLRIVLCYALVLILHEYPIPQSIILTILSLFSFIYALVARPMKEAFGLVETLVFEMIVLIVNLCVILLAVLDNNGQEALEQRERIGAVIILCNTIMRILSTIFVVTSLLLNIREIYLAKKNKIPGNKLSLRRILSLVFFHGSVRTTAPQAPRPVLMTFRAKEKPLENKEEQETKREIGKKNPRKIYMVTNIDTFENDKILSTDPHLTNEGLSVTQTRSFAEQKSLFIHHRPIQILHYENPASHQTFQDDLSEASPPISPSKYPRYSSIESLNESQSPQKMLPRRSRGSLVETFFPEFEKRNSVGSNNSEENVNSLVEMTPQLKSLQSTNRRESRRSIKILVESEEQVAEVKTPVKISNMRDKSLLKLSLRNIKRRSRRLETIHEHEKKVNVEEVEDEIGSKSTGNPDFMVDYSEITLRSCVKENSNIPYTREFLEVPSQSQGDFSGRGSPVPSDCSSGEGSGSECGEKMEVGGNGEEKSRRSIFGRVGAGGQRRNSNISDAKEEVEEVFT